MTHEGNVLLARNADALYPVYSLSKTYIACLCLTAQRQRLFELDDSLAHFAPEVPDAKKITLRQLLNHTAGLPDYGSLRSYHEAIANGEAPWSDQTFATQTYDKGLSFEPGERFHYSNPGYALLVRILQQAYDQDLSQILLDQIVRPLDLRQTEVLATLDRSDIVSAQSTCLSVAGQAKNVGRHYGVGWVWHRLIGASARDACEFLSALFEGRLLSQAELAQMTETVTVDHRNSQWQAPSYGLGVMHERASTHGPAFGHNGDGPGYCCSGFYFPQQRRAVVVLASTENSDLSYRVVGELIEQIYDKHP